MGSVMDGDEIVEGLAVVDAGDATVFHFGQAIGVGVGAGIVGDDDDATAWGTGGGGEEIHDLVTGFAIQCGGGFVGDEESGFVDEGAGDGDALLLAAGELAGAFAFATGETDAGEECGGLVFGFAAAGAVEEEGDGDVFDEVEGGDEVELLEDEADVTTAEGGDGRSGEVVEAGAEEVDVAFVPLEGAGGDGEEGGLAATGRADDEVEFALGGGEVGALEGEGAGIAGTEGLDDAGETDGGGIGRWRGEVQGGISCGTRWRLRDGRPSGCRGGRRGCR